MVFANKTVEGKLVQVKDIWNITKEGEEDAIT